MSNPNPTPPADTAPAPATPVRTVPAADAAPAPAAATLPVGALPPRGARGPWVLAVLLGALAAAGLTAYVGLERSNEALVQRLQQLESEGAAAAERGEQALRAARAETQKLADDLERLRQQRADLDQLYLDLTRGRDEAALWEVERLVTVAAQELQVGGNLGTALAALQAADARLARIDRPQLVNLRRALSGDIERLRSAPAVDLTGLAVKLDQLAAAVDGWPLLAEPPRKGPLAPAAAIRRRPAPGPACVAGCAKSSAGCCRSARSTHRRHCCSTRPSSGWRDSRCGCGCSTRGRRCCNATTSCIAPIWVRRSSCWGAISTRGSRRWRRQQRS